MGMPSTVLPTQPSQSHTLSCTRPSPCAPPVPPAGSPPYYDLQPLSALYNIVQDPHPPLPPDISSGMLDFLLACFQKARFTCYCCSCRC